LLADPPWMPGLMGKIVVVDDDDGVRDVLAEVIRTHGHEVVAAANGREALDQLRGAGADLILLDLMMPVMNGWEFRRVQLDDRELARIPVVLISGASHLRDEGSRLGVVDWLRKPFRPRDIVAMIDRYCPMTPAAC
jgi:CheY-like chemotaxis protein